MHLRDLLSGVAERLELHDETIPGIPLLELYGNNRILIEHHRGVQKFGAEEIAVCMAYGMVCIRGQQLQLRSMSEGQLVISGEIEQLNVLKGEA